MVIGVESVSASPNVVFNDDGSTSITTTVSDSGEFTITPKSSGGLNCKNDYISWSFDFTGVEFLTPISKAELKLKVIPKIPASPDPSRQSFSNDRVQIEGLSWIAGITPADYTVDDEICISLNNLLDYQDYSSVNILSVLEENDHKIPFRYEDDACVQKATLKLVVTCPATNPPTELPCLSEDPCDCNPCAPGCPTDRVFDCKEPILGSVRTQ